MTRQRERCQILYRPVFTQSMPPKLVPADVYNAELLTQTHPQDWKNPVPAERYDLVAIGGGTAGIISALGTAGLGGKAALIERHLLGGDCLNYGCVPSKALIAAARAVRCRESLASLAFPPVQ